MDCLTVIYNNWTPWLLYRLIPLNARFAAYFFFLLLNVNSWLANVDKLLSFAAVIVWNHCSGDGKKSHFHKKSQFIKLTSKHVHTFVH